MWFPEAGLDITKSNFWQIGRTIPFWVSSIWQEIRVEVLLSGDWQLHEADGTWQAISKKRRLWSRKQVCLTEERDAPHLNWESQSPVAWDAFLPAEEQRQPSQEWWEDRRIQRAEHRLQNSFRHFNTINAIHFLKVLWKSRFYFILLCGFSSLEPSRRQTFSIFSSSKIILTVFPNV